MIAMELTDGRESTGSFSTEIAEHIPMLRRMAKQLTRNEEAAADLTQETLAKAWAARRTFVAGTNLKAWLITIMRNQYRSEMRRAWRQTSWEEESFEQIPAPQDEQTWSIELGDAARAISSLSRYQREALILSGVGGFTGDDVATIVHCGRAAAKSRVCRARHAVQSMLDGTEPLKSRRGRSSRDSINDLLHELQSLAASRAALPEARHNCD
jgi:RNA polymerase sigma-70 factor, ECF subfamily